MSAQSETCLDDVVGDLSVTSLARVMIELLARQASGTLVLEPDEVHPRSLRLLWASGTITAGSSSGDTGFFALVASAFDRSGGYRFYPGESLLAASATRGVMDPLWAVTQAIFAGKCSSEVDDLVRRLPPDRVLVRNRELVCARLGLPPALLSWLEQREELTVGELLMCEDLEAREACEALCVLLLTGAIRSHGDPALTLPACGAEDPASGDPMARTGRRRRESHASGREVTTLPAGAPHTERAADYYASALGHTREERWSEATSDLWRAIQLEPNVAEYHETLAWVLLKQHKSGSGPLRVMLQVIDRAIELDPDQHRALYLRSLILRRMGRLDDARTTLRRALKLRPDDPQIRRDLRDMLKQEQRETKSWIRRLLR